MLDKYSSIKVTYWHNRQIRKLNSFEIVSEEGEGRGLSTLIPTKTDVAT